MRTFLLIEYNVRIKHSSKIYDLDIEEIWELMCNFANGMRYMSKKNKEIEINEPRMVKSHDVKLDTEYAEWIALLKNI